jgi:hypothetical protein
MKKIGFATLPLHPGRAPPWLFKRMVKLAKGIIEIVLYEYNHDGFLKRLSDPYWFQAFSCVLGFDWHSSGTTTVTCGALKEALNPEEHGLAVLGGKGKASRKTSEEITRVGDVFSISSKKINKLVYSSKMSAKVDNTALQDGHQLYHHVFILTEKGKWAVIQQGMNPENQTARRYHWLSSNVKSFIEEPHTGIISDLRYKEVLNMIAKESEVTRRVSTDLIKEHPKKICNLIKIVSRPSYQSTLNKWFGKEIKTLSMPQRINWTALERAYEEQPTNYEGLLAIKGMGPSTIRALALISDLIYGKEPSWKDPARYSFAHGGKDGIPRPVDRELYDKSIKTLEEFIQQAKIGNKDKLHALKRLHWFESKPL